MNPIPDTITLAKEYLNTNRFIPSVAEEIKKTSALELGSNTWVTEIITITKTECSVMRGGMVPLHLIGISTNVSYDEISKWAARQVKDNALKSRVENHKAYWGVKSSHDAEYRLSNKEQGTWLYRFDVGYKSVDNPGGHVLTQVGHFNKVQHISITRDFTAWPDEALALQKPTS